ncbi:hypothetical protein LCGC14_2543720, partial [marine sediment metagenome]
MIIGEVIVYVFLSGLIFYLFFFLLTIFGFSISKLFLKPIDNNKNQGSIIGKIFISFGIGTSIYLAISMILLGLKAFNFFTAYLPFILFDCSYISYKLIVIIKNNDIKDIFNILNSWFHKNGKILFKILLFMIILLLITG